VANESQELHEREESIASDPPGTEGSMKIEAGILLDDSVRSRRQAEIDIAVCGADSNQWVEK
jgi:hypothetical protein